MSARDAVPVKTEQDLADDHVLRIIRAKLRNHMVGCRGLNRFVVAYHHHKNDDEVIFYLSGITDQVRPSEITILEQPK